MAGIDENEDSLTCKSLGREVWPGNKEMRMLLVTETTTGVQWVELALWESQGGGIVHGISFRSRVTGTVDEAMRSLIKALKASFKE